MTPEQQQGIETVKDTADWIAVPVSVGFFFGMVQGLAGIAALIYTCYRIYDLWDKRRKRPK